MILSYKRKLDIWNNIREMIKHRESIVIISAGDLYEEIVSYACVASQFEEEKPSLVSRKNAWTLKYQDFNIEFYDVGDEEQIEVFTSRHIIEDTKINYVVTFELESNTLVWDAYISEMSQIIEYKDQQTVVIRGYVYG